MRIKETTTTSPGMNEKSQHGIKDYNQGVHSAAEGRFRGLVIQNFLDMVGFYMLVRGYPEVFGHQ